VYSDWIGRELNLTIYTFGVAFTLFALDNWLTDYLILFSPLCANREIRDPLIYIIKAIFPGYEPKSSGLKSFKQVIKLPDSFLAIVVCCGRILGDKSVFFGVQGLNGI
jgi:hypothetical protein